MIEYDYYYLAPDKRREKRTIRNKLVEKYHISLRVIRRNRLDNPLMSELARKVMINESRTHIKCFKNRITRRKHTKIPKKMNNRVNQHV